MVKLVNRHVQLQANPVLVPLIAGPLACEDRLDHLSEAGAHSLRCPNRGYAPHGTKIMRQVLKAADRQSDLRILIQDEPGGKKRHPPLRAYPSGVGRGGAIPSCYDGC